MTQSSVSSPFKMTKLDDSSLNPLKLVEKKLHALVLQHLTGSDLLQMSEVSHEWNDVVATSGMAQKKIRLVINEGWRREFDEGITKDSNRKYQNVKINTLLRLRNQVITIFPKFAEHLTSIDTTFDFETKDVKLPAVRSLKMSTSDFFEEGLLGSVSGLTSLHIYGDCNHPEKIVECLRANKNLEELILENNAPRRFFGCGINENIDIKLKCLKLDDVNFQESDTMASLKYFLECQEDYIREIKLLQCDFYLLTKILNNMPNLERVTFSQAVSQLYNTNRILIKQREKLTEVNLIMVSFNVLQSMISYAPNLKKLYVADPNFKMYEFIVRNVTNLREFSYAYYRGGDGTVEAMQRFEETNKPSVRKSFVVKQI